MANSVHVLLLQYLYHCSPVENGDNFIGLYKVQALATAATYWLDGNPSSFRSWKVGQPSASVYQGMLQRTMNPNLSICLRSAFSRRCGLFHLCIPVQACTVFVWTKTASTRTASAATNMLIPARFLEHRVRIIDYNLFVNNYKLRNATLLRDRTITDQNQATCMPSNC